MCDHMLRSKQLVHVLPILLLLFISSKFAFGSEIADWSILVYLNSKNNLEKEGLSDFKEMATVGGNDKIHLVVQMGRPLSSNDPASGQWGGIKRFLVTKGTQPTEKDQVMDVGSSWFDTDMGAIKTFESFVRWAANKYPAKRTMLVIWNHGQGWRFQLAPDKNSSTAQSSVPRDASDLELLTGQQVPGPLIGGYRAVSSDGDTKNILYNNEIQEALTRLKAVGIRIDIIAFDACLMNMVETSYAFRNLASYFVGSQDLEPGDGWAYASWLKRLHGKPSSTPKELAKSIVNAYGEKYGRFADHTTQSALDLSAIGDAVSNLTALANKMKANIKDERQSIQDARAKQATFGDEIGYPLYTSIDLITFLENYSTLARNPEIRDLARKTAIQFESLVLRNYASDNSGPPYSARGISIYFPANLRRFKEDEFNRGYLPENKYFPVEFVEREGWSKFLLAYLRVPQ